VLTTKWSLVLWYFVLLSGDADGASTVPVANIMCWVCLDGHTPLIGPLRDVMSVPLCKVRTLFDRLSYHKAFIYFPRAAPALAEYLAIITRLSSLSYLLLWFIWVFSETPQFSLQSSFKKSSMTDVFRIFLSGI